MQYVFLSFIAGLLTIVSPCVLPLLPVVLAESSTEKNWKTPFVIIASMAVSIFAFTLLLKVSTVFLDVNESIWQNTSGVLIVIVGAALVFPNIWTFISMKIGLLKKTHELQNASLKKTGVIRNILLGASLGPIFTSCSPTYGIILATVFPSSYTVGLLNLFVYVFGLALILGAIAIGGQRVIKKISWASKSDGWFKKSLGVLLIILGVLIATGLIRDLETWWASSSFNFNDFEIDKIREIRK